MLSSALATTRKSLRAAMLMSAVALAFVGMTTPVRSDDQCHKNNCIRQCDRASLLQERSDPPPGWERVRRKLKADCLAKCDRYRC